MTRLTRLTLCLVLAVLTGSASVNAETVSFDMFLTNTAYTETLKDNSTAAYADMIARVKEYFTPIGGNSEVITISNGGGCVKINIMWTNGNQTSFTEIIDRLKEDGFFFKGQTSTVSFTGCSAETTVLRFKFYAVNMQWSETFQEHNSSEYKELLQNVQDIFSDLGGSIRALEMAQNFGCVEFYVEWDALNSTSIIGLTSSLETNGIIFMNQKYMIQIQPCGASPAEPTLLRFKFYVVSMQWSETFLNHSSTEYQEVMQDTADTFSNLGGSLRALEMSQNYGCLEFYLEWNALNIATIMDYIPLLKKNGITIMNQTYTVQTKPCEMPTAEVGECPELPEGTIGICMDACDDNSTDRKCSEGFKCCPNGCGRLCQRVGYAVKINTTIVIDLNWVENMADQGSSVFLQLEEAAKIMVQRSFNVENPDLVRDVKLIKISQYNVQDQPISLLGLEFFLNDDMPNVELEPGRSRLLKDGNYIDSGSFRVVDVHLGSSSASPASVCGGVECYGICKELRSDVQYCSCNPGYVGPDCATFYCRTESSLSSDTNSSLCENGGECVRKLQGLDFECQCQPGYSGPLCQVNLNSCPVVLARRPGLIGLCQSTCSGGDCEGEKLCCKVPCGGNACVDVGYHQKMMANVILNFPYTPELNDSNSFEFQMLKSGVEDSINAMMRQNNVVGFKSATIVGFGSSTGGQMTRRKRELDNTIILWELRFINEVPVEDVSTIRDSLLATGFDVGGTNWTVFNITYGTEGGCPYMTCAPGSFCVTNFGGEVQCACPKTRSGQLCDVKTCNSAGTSLCKNGGTCSYSNTDMQMSCKCPSGFTGELCEVRDVCALGLCLNGGKCQSLPGGGHYCECPEGFSGSVCEDAATHCPSGQPLMTTSGERQCRRQPCPVGFQCNVHPSDKWTACCFKEDFLCDLNPCMAGGVCYSNFNSGTVCSCPKGRQGLFCEESSNDTIMPTACHMKQLFNNWVISILETGTSSLKITLEEMRVILQHMGYQYIPTDICDEQGNFKTVAQGVWVLNPTADRVKICMDASGNYDPDCKVAICDVLSDNGNMKFCMNGGICVGEITQKLCDCSGTGYYGIRCELSGAEGTSETNCTLRRDIAYLAIGVLNGSSGLPGFSRETAQVATKEVLSLYKTNNIFVPYCDEKGQYEYRGCLYMTEDTSKKNCYCALDDGTNFGSEESPLEPPPNCRKDSCPEEWGEECERPDWWCLEKVQCQPYTERCAYYTGCTGTVCTQQAEVGCVAKGTVLPCDLHPCKDDPFSMCQPCGVHGTCYNIGSVNKSSDMGYRCECKIGFSGPECETNENVCSIIPKNMCESDCIGDVNDGQLCRCDPGYGGMFCDKPARSLCERRKALYDDVISILSGEISPRNGYSVAEMQNMVKSVIQAVGGDGIPVLNCTDQGFYAKVQCMVSVNSLEDKECYCVDFNGKTISSNIRPYVGYDVCTAPTNPRELAETACNVPVYLDLGDLTVCLNGGTCIFDIYAGKFCSCPDGYYGQFCQHQGNVSDSDEPQSLCEFFSDAWVTAFEISTGRADWITSDLQKQLYLNLSFNFLQLQNNQSYALKAECQEDGTFKPAACYHNVRTGEKGSCYCWNLRGLLVEGLAVENADDSNECSGMSDTTCPKLKCLYHCKHGYRMNNGGCRTCDCKNPCEDVTCGLGQRCVIEKATDCYEDDVMPCTKAVCMSADKPGACPGYSPELFSSVPDELLAFARNSSSCSVTCRDDTDCEGLKKCCGLCDSTCVEPQGTYTCKDYQMKMNAQLEFINLARDELMTTRNLSPAEIRMLERIIDIHYIWIPSCEDNDQDMFKPLQCEHVLDNSGVMGDVSSCFCVDRKGNRIEGAKANASNPASCNVKPFSCPFVEPAQNSNTAAVCTEDLDCLGGEKCCGNLGNQICQTPVDTSKLTTTLDRLMSTLCENNSDMCQGGSHCVGTWMDKGIACECPSNRVGPFCEHVISDVMVVPNTTCERKNVAFTVFIEQLQEMNSSLSFSKLLDSVTDYDDMKFDIASTVWYNCTEDGAFVPKQCVVNAYDASWELPKECFCVYSDGTEILGTRTPMKDGQTLFCGDNNLMCPRGNPYHEDSGELHDCEDKDDCPMGYTCRRSTYGKLYCCPTVEGEKSDCLSRQVKAMRSQSFQKSATNGNACDVMHIPVCEKDGTWASEQCQPALGICWCVSPQGNYINNTITRGVPQCSTASESMMMKADQSQIDISQVNFSVCDNGKDFHCCSKTLCAQTCFAHPDAVCLINPCGGCKAEYYSTDGRMVDCSEDLTPCEQELKLATAAVQEHQINVAIARGEDVGGTSVSKKSSAQPARLKSLSTAYPGRCQLQPDTGSCRGFQRQWYFDPASGKCDMFIWGLCEGNDNRFQSPEECYDTCSPSSNPCLNVNCSVSNTACKLQYDEECYTPEVICNVTAVCTARDPELYLVKDIFIPSCQATGEYSYKQCLGNYCWCVNSTGHYVNGLTVEQSFSLICTENGTGQSISDTDKICLGGNQPNIACMKACTSKVCPGQPEALCVADLCSSDCSTKFVDNNGQEVKCTDDVCKVFTFDESEKCTDNVLCPGTTVKTCPESVCEQAMRESCSKNPCAVCLVDPCTCQPYFVDARSSSKLTEAQCDYLTLGMCELQVCNILSDTEKAKDNQTYSNLPACDDKGIFQPKQCQSSRCQCVDQFGVSTVGNADGSCKAIDKIKRIKVTFTFRADFSTFKMNNKLQILVDMLLKKLKEVGIDSRIIKYTGDPYEGSVKVDVNFEDNAEAYNKDLALILKVLEQLANSGELDLTIDGQPVALMNITEEVKTESQVAEENGGEEKPKTDDGDELDRNEKIIIGVVCGVVGLLIIGIISYCLCCRKRQQKEALDDSFEHVRDSKKPAYDNSIPVYNQVFEDDNSSVKVRL